MGRTLELLGPILGLEKGRTRLPVRPRWLGLLGPGRLLGLGTAVLVQQALATRNH
jgi:hypothetical protein